MQSIRLNRLLPRFFADQRTSIHSEVWLSEVCFERGRSYLIEAESGRGKSSLCRFIYGESNLYEGDIVLGDTMATQLGNREWTALRMGGLSMLFQDLRLFPELTARENIDLKNRLSNHLAASRIDELFELLEIGDRQQMPVARLSLGQQQRVALIRALCQPFDFLLLDEPVSHLDPRISAVMARVVADEAAQRGACVIATSVGVRLPLEYDKTLSL